jgi:hypothetical protein
MAANSRPRGPEGEPDPLAGEVAFEEGDFHCLSERVAPDPQFNDRRLVARRKVLTLAKRAQARFASQGLALDCRTSLHHPTTFNGMRVRRLWAYLMRGAAEKKRLRGVLGPELGRDLDSAFRNAYLCLAIEDGALEVSLRIHTDAWYDGQNLVNRLAAQGTAMWRALLNQLGGFRLRMADWKGEWRCGALTGEQLAEFLKYYKPGEHLFAVEQRLPAPRGQRGAALEAGTPELLVSELDRLLPLYRFTAWSLESDFLFAK